MNRKQRFAQNMLELSNRSQARNIADYCVKAMPYLYSAVAIVLFENYGFREKRLSKFFDAVYDVWSEYADNGELGTLADVCSERTGIRIEYREDKIERAIIDGGNNGYSQKKES